MEVLKRSYKASMPENSFIEPLYFYSHQANWYDLSESWIVPTITEPNYADKRITDSLCLYDLCLLWPYNRRPPRSCLEFTKKGFCYALTVNSEQYAAIDAQWGIYCMSLIWDNLDCIFSLELLVHWTLPQNNAKQMEMLVYYVPVCETF